MSWWALYILIGVFAFVCLVMTLLILIQKGRGGGLASAFGGAGGNTAFGSKTGDVLTWATSVVFGVFLLLAIVLNLVANSVHARASGRGAAPAPTTAPATPAPGSAIPDGSTTPAPSTPVEAPSTPPATAPSR